MTEIESSNIHLKWLENIYNHFIELQEMETLALEGCNSIAEYLEIPYESKEIIIPEIQYKNLKFIVRKLNSLIDILSPTLNSDTNTFKTKLKPVIENIDNRKLFLEENYSKNQLTKIKVKKLMNDTIKYVLDIKSDLLVHNKISNILYLNESKKKEW